VIVQYQIHVPRNVRTVLRDANTKQWGTLRAFFFFIS